ncbi:MAG: hypothetical protein MCS20_01005 [Candidatus Phytoplasma mali]|nr:hypothetical protein [Candidatus Karelsulcia muelleri]MCG7201979.1 hypothetical protein [Candidatus Phytoplasma mali]MCZ8631809.1 hypothetical protein [Spiroplasma sp. Tabriz.8]
MLYIYFFFIYIYIYIYILKITNIILLKFNNKNNIFNINLKITHTCYNIIFYYKF